jgi:hypothetical protein
MKKVKCVVINNENFDNISKNLQEKLQIYNLQTYFPILSLFFKFYNNSKKQFTLKMNNYIVDINEKIDVNNNDSYIKNFFNCKIKNFNSGSVVEKKVFFKILPLLNISQYMMNEYSDETSILPNIYSYLTNKKINNYHNSAYIDCFFSYLASNLTESGCCPTFPIFYGTYSGVAKEFKADITEEYSLMKNQDWFDFFNNKLFTVEKSKLDLNNSSKSSFELDIDLQDSNLHDNTQNNDIESEELNIEEINFNQDPENQDENNQDAENQDENNQDPENQDAENQDPENQDANNQDAENQDAENQDPENQDAENQDPENQDENNQDPENQDASNQDPENQDDNNSCNSDGKWSDVTSDDEYNEIFEDIRLQKVDIGEDKVDIHSVSSLSASLCSNLSFNSIGNNEVNFVNVYDFPVQLNCIEMLNNTLDNYLEENGEICDTEWKSILFQICFGLAVAQKKFNFVHNDLHSSNIMFKDTKLEYLYFNFKGKYFKLPTFGKIVKIIDFGRATFSVGNNIFFSDVFKKNGDAEGQYSFPYNNTLNNCKIRPNKSFDLSRLATTIIEHFKEDTPIFKLLKLWASDKYGNFLMNYDDDFNLYKIIAKNVKSAIPKNQINKMIFKQFILEKEDINNEEFIYNY